MKRIISTILILTFVLSLSVTTAFADSSAQKQTGWAKKGFKLPPGIEKKIFGDLDDFSWAKDAIEKMNLKGLIQGYGNGVFAPKNAVTKIEAVIMSLRVMGWEDEAKSTKELPKKYKGKNVADWAKGYVSIAYEKGILDEVDMMYFNPQESAKRHEVAKYVIRALGYEEEAEDNMDSDLPFVDEAAVPVGSIGYVYLINDLGIMKGDNAKKFNPMGTLTRAEMAVLFDRVDGKVDSDIDEDEVTGEVYKVRDEEITLRIDGQLKTFEVEDDVIVYDQDGRIDFEDIEIGSTVVLQIEDDEVIYIEVVDEDEEKIISRFSGTVIDIDDESIEIEVKTMRVAFEVIDRVEVYFDDEKGSFDEVEVDDEVSVVVDDRNRVRKIYVERDREEQDIEDIEGAVTDIDLSGSYHIEIDDVEYDLSEDAEVTMDNDEYELDDIIKGDTVEVKLVDDVVTEIEIISRSNEVEGIALEIGSSAIKVKVNDGVKKYFYAGVFTVYVDGREEEFSDLERGMKVELRTRNNLVYRIDAEDYDDEFELEGKIDAVLDNGSELRITIDGEKFTYDIDEDVEIEIDGEDDMEVSDLRRNQEGIFTIDNDTIIEMEIE
ncbi:MAG: S-layer homology domain-containing protein [Clostridia bacterium]